MRYFPILLCITTFICCAPGVGKQYSKATTQLLPEVYAIDAQFPFRLLDLDSNSTANTIQIRDNIESEIRKTIYIYFYNVYGGNKRETNFKLKHIYFGTFRLIDTSHTLYLLLFLAPGSFSQITSEVLFYDNTTKVFTDKPFNFMLSSLYYVENGEIKYSNLKDQLKYDFPEIELVDYDNDGTKDFKFTRLYHNGTANAVETTILTIANSQIDTLAFNREWIGQEPEKQ